MEPEHRLDGSVCDGRVLRAANGPGIGPLVGAAASTGLILARRPPELRWIGYMRCRPHSCQWCGVKAKRSGAETSTAPEQEPTYTYMRASVVAMLSYCSMSTCMCASRKLQYDLLSVAEAPLSSLTGSEESCQWAANSESSGTGRHGPGLATEYN